MFKYLNVLVSVHPLTKVGGIPETRFINKEQKLRLINFNDSLWVRERPIKQRIIEVLIDCDGEVVWGEVKHRLCIVCEFHPNGSKAKRCNPTDISKNKAIMELIEERMVLKESIGSNKVKLRLSKAFYEEFHKYLKQNRLLEEPL